jgi:hypothetical protein
MRHYCKYRNKNKSVVQTKRMQKTKKLQFRLSGDDLILFEKHKEYFGIENESEFIRQSFMDTVYKNEIKRQQFEISGI